MSTETFKRVASDAEREFACTGDVRLLLRAGDLWSASGDRERAIALWLQAAEIYERAGEIILASALRAQCRDSG
jgi:hypothetical protein